MSSQISLSLPPGAQFDLIVRSFCKALDADKPAASPWRARSLRRRSDSEETSAFTLPMPKASLNPIPISAAPPKRLHEIWSTSFLKDELVLWL
ncbi:MAG: hypothetical protein ACI88C_000998 [Acidimicrobiales bacterium]